jgi:glycosyltransferase involved in cell wall biosynthesis
MSQSKPLISIIIPVLNREDIISETLDSVLAQSYENWECITVDDGSSDQSKNVVRNYVKKDKRFKLFDRPNEHKPGGAGARNFGYKLSKGEIIQWFDSDDIMHKELLREKIEIFEKHKDIACVISPLTFFEGEKVIGQNTLEKKYDHLYENIISWTIPVWTQSIMFRRSFLDIVERKFDEDLERLMDYEFYGRMYIHHQPKTWLHNNRRIFIRRNNANAISTNFFDQRNISKLQKSESIVKRKLIELLISEHKFSRNLEKFFYQDHKRRMTQLVMIKDYETADLFQESVSFFLKRNNKIFKLIRFRIGFILLKTMPLDNVFLVYRFPRYLKILNKIFFSRGYFKENVLQILPLRKTSY